MTRVNKSSKVKAVHPLFQPQDRYFVTAKGWWFYTVDAIGGPFANKPDCVDACRRHIQNRSN